MLVEGRINPPPSTRQSVDLSSAAGVAALPAAAASPTFIPLSPHHLPSHQLSSAQRTEQGENEVPVEVGQENDDEVRRPFFARPTERRRRRKGSGTAEVQDHHQQECTQSTAAALASELTTSSRRTAAPQRHWRTPQSQSLICKILTLFSSPPSTAAALLPSLPSWPIASSLRQTSTTIISSSSNQQHSKRSHRGESRTKSSASSTATPAISHRRFSPIISVIATLLLLLFLTLTMGSGVHCSSFNSHHSSTHSTTTSSPSSSSSSSTQSSQSANPPNAGLIEHAEKLFFGQMGLQRAPTPPREAKVPQYMMDLYHWFRSNNHDRQMLLADEEEDEGGNHPHRRLDSSSPSKAVIVALTGDDIAELSNEINVDQAEDEDEEEARLIAAVNGHRRAPNRRRPSQASRVTLTGAASTVVGHKMNNHDHDRINRRRTRRSVDGSSSTSPLAAVNEAHLTFDVHLTAGQQLRGAELRLYRHSIYEARRAAAGDSLVEPSSMKAKESEQHGRGPNHLYHWSVRYRLLHQQPTSSSRPSITTTATTGTPTENNNSHSSASGSSSSSGSSKSSSSATSTGSSSSGGGHSSGEEYSAKEASFLQRINVHYLLRPVEELHPVTIRSGGGGGGQQQQQQQQLRPVSKLIDTQVVDVRQAGWLSFDIAAAVEHWLRRPAENYGLLVTFTDVAGRPHQEASSWSKLVVVNREDSHHHSAVQSTTTTTTTTTDDLDEDHPWHEVQPLVITFSGQAEEEGKRTVVKPKRVKRNNNNHSNGGGGGSSSGQQHHHKRKSSSSSSKRRRRPEKSHAAREVCSRKPMFFDFQAVGWMDWILAPPGFQAYYCQGRCEYPMAEHLNYTNHATIQALVNSVNFNLVPSPCCVPTELSPVTLLYYDTNNKVVLTNYHDMVVEGCGCR